MPPPPKPNPPRRCPHSFRNAVRERAPRKTTGLPELVPLPAHCMAQFRSMLRDQRRLPRCDRYPLVPAALGSIAVCVRMHVCVCVSVCATLRVIFAIIVGLLSAIPYFDVAIISPPDLYPCIRFRLYISPSCIPPRKISWPHPLAIGTT